MMLSSSTHPERVKLGELSGSISNAAANLSSLYHQYGAILRHLPSLQLEANLVELCESPRTSPLPSLRMIFSLD